MPSPEPMVQMPILPSIVNHPQEPIAYAQAFGLIIAGAATPRISDPKPGRRPPQSSGSNRERWPLHSQRVCPPAMPNWLEVFHENVQTGPTLVNFENAEAQALSFQPKQFTDGSTHTLPNEDLLALPASTIPMQEQLLVHDSQPRQISKRGVLQCVPASTWTNGRERPRPILEMGGTSRLS